MMAFKVLALAAAVTGLQDGASGIATDDWKFVECDGSGAVHTTTLRHEYERENSQPFHAVFRFNAKSAEIVEASGADDVPRLYPIGMTKDGNALYLSGDMDWTLTFFKSTGRFELKASRLSKVGFAIRNDNFAGACKRYEASNVFD
jgi:hypothetical protein